MGIEKTMGGFTGFDIECDHCEETEYLDYDWTNLQGAVSEARSFGWTIQYIHDEWECVCPECLRKESGN